MRLQLFNVSKRFGETFAVRNVTLSLPQGIVTGLIGGNGAGKSTLAKIITGELAPSAGAIGIDDELCPTWSYATARRAGVRAVYQDLALCPDLTAAENILLGDEDDIVNSIGVIRRKLATDETERRLRQIGIGHVQAHDSVRHLSGGQRQAVALARIMSRGLSLAILDEPTAALAHDAKIRVWDLVRQLTREHVAVLLISHVKEEVELLADRVAVIEEGRLVVIKECDMLADTL
jgi:ABC-type sugar transport system ATPase subunit